MTEYYGWWPNLAEEKGNHLIELAVAGGARAIVTHNVRDLRRGELRWRGLSILTRRNAWSDWHDYFDDPPPRRYASD